jgi:hypothetical protein
MEKLDIALEKTLLQREDEIIARMELESRKNSMCQIKDQKLTSAQIQNEIDNCNRRKRAIVEQRNGVDSLSYKMLMDNLQCPGTAL